jgi:hypothetical protein
VKKTDGKAGTLSNVVEITKPAAEIRLKIQQQTEQARVVQSPMTPRDTLINYKKVLETEAIYLAELEQDNLQPIIDSKIKMIAGINRWLGVRG